MVAMSNQGQASLPGAEPGGRCLQNEPTIVFNIVGQYWTPVPLPAAAAGLLQPFARVQIFLSSFSLFSFFRSKSSRSRHDRHLDSTHSVALPYPPSGRFSGDE